MIVQFLPAVLLGTVGLCVSLVKDRNFRQPTGPRMCERLCKDMVGCSSYAFNIIGLSCYLTHDDKFHHGNEKGIYLLQAVEDDERKHVKRELKCRNNARIYHTRGNQILCKLVWPRQKAQRRNPKTRILLLVRSYEDHAKQARQLHLHNNSITLNPFIKTLMPIALAYISSLRTLVIVMETPVQLLFVNVDNGNKNIIEMKSGFNGIAVDDIQHLIFLLSWSNPRGLHVMTTGGKHLKLLTTLKDVSKGIAVDVKRALVHVIQDNSIVRFNYSGGFKGSVHILKIGLSTTLCSDSERDVLYYDMGSPSVIYKMFLSNFSSIYLFQLRLDVSNLYSYKDSFYGISYKGMIVISQSGNITEMNTGLGQRNALYFCAIP